MADILMDIALRVIVTGYAVMALFAVVVYRAATSRN